MEEKLNKILSELKKLDELNNKVDQYNEKTVKLEKRVVELEEVNVKLQKRLEYFELKMDSIESHSKKSNLVFKGVEESKASESWEKCKEIIIDVVKEELGIELKKTDIERAHRLHTKYKPRPIIVRFHHFQQKELILEEKSKIKNEKIFITEDYTRRVQYERKKLLEKMREAREKECYAVVHYNKLVIDKVWYVYDWKSGKVVRQDDRPGAQGIYSGDPETDEEVVCSEEEGKKEESILPALSPAVKIKDKNARVKVLVGEKKDYQLRERGRHIKNK